MGGCRVDDAPLDGEGKVLLTTVISSDVEFARSQTDSELADNCLVWISNSKGLVRSYKGLSSVPAEGISLVTGKYVAEAWTGDSVAASFEARYFTGVQDFEVKSGSTSDVHLKCRIANTVVAVKYADQLDDVLSDYTVTVGHGGNDLIFEGRDDERRGYYMMSSRSKNLQWTVEGTLQNGDTFRRTGVIENARRSTLYTININYTSASDEEVGGAFLDIVVDETAIEVNDEVIIKVAPGIRGVDFDMADGYRCKPGRAADMSFYVSAAAALDKVIVECPALAVILGSSATDLRSLSIDQRESFAAKGISYVYGYDAANDVSAMTIELKGTLFSQLPEGTYTLKITATDADGRENFETLDITIAEGDPTPVVMLAVDDRRVWAKSANVSATLRAEASATRYGFKYRVKGTSDWTTIVCTPLGNAISATLSPLQPATEYEVVAFADDVLSDDIMTFVTEAALQLPNAGFEQTYTSGSTIFFASSANDLFWDSGNTGSSTMRKNVTEPDTSVKHGGNQSVRMSSQFVGMLGIGKFAAGNIFIGKYLKTQGTDGVLGWGRSFTSRPKALHGWIKYNPAAVQYTNADYTEVSEGDMDKGIVYIALLTDHTEDFEGSAFPVIIKTKNDDTAKRQLFDRNADNVIAYGEKIWTEATPGSDMVEFTIDLTYSKENIKPANIMIVGAASKGGDYFAGGPSVMWLDDLELIY